MYAAASIFAPSYKAYYRRILSFSEEFMRTVQVLDRKCERLATIFKVFLGYLRIYVFQTKCPNDISLPNISSSHVWITNLLLSNMSPMSQSLQETWNPVSRHICFVLDNLFESGSYDDKFVQYWSHILSPATSLIRCFLLNLSQVTEWFRINQQTRSPTTFALSFLSVCAQYYPMSEEEILQSFPLAFRLAVYQSLLHHRSDIDSLNEFWLQFARTQIHHCGSSSWNSIGLPESLCSPTSNSVDITFAGISKRMLTSLSREDFIANQGGQLPSKGKYQTTDACLFNSFNKISSAKSYYLSEEQECSWIEASVDDSSTHTHLPNSEDLDGLDHAEILSQSRFSEDERIHEV